MDESIVLSDLARTELTDKEEKMFINSWESILKSANKKMLDKSIDTQIVDFMAEYIEDHDVPSLIELVLKAIQKVEGSEE